MSTTHYLSERAKYDYILQLSKDQIRALEANDFATFKKILTAKGTLIKSLSDGQTLLTNDPSLQKIVQQIKDSEHFSEKLLYRRLGQIKRQLNEIGEFQLSRRAYKTIGSSARRFALDPDAAMLFDS